MGMIFLGFMEIFLKVVLVCGGVFAFFVRLFHFGLLLKFISFSCSVFEH